MEAENNKVIRQPEREPEEIAVHPKHLAKLKWPDLKRPAIKFPIVGLGCSAGGLDALERFFLHMPRIRELLL